MAYEAIVTRIKVRPHPGADRLQLGTCCGNQVVVGLDTADDELGVFFPTDGQLSEEFVLANGLYSEAARRKLGLPVVDGEKYGFFSDKRRVRAQSFRGQKSDGFWVPLNDFETFGVFPFIEGDTFTAVNGTEMCQKYVTKATQAAREGKIGRRQKANICFPKHDVTKQFRYFSDSIPNDAVIYLTEKLHGTSGRYGRVLDEVSLPLWKRLLNRLGAGFPEQAYVYLNGSKNVILEKTTGGGYYGTHDFRYTAIEGVSLRKGEVLYFEIVGYVGDRPIMDPHVIKDEVKSLRKQYGDLMVYDYGLQPPNCDIYVYRIAQMNEDGQGVDLSWPQVVQRCTELGLKTVPLLLGPITEDQSIEEMKVATADLINELTEGPSTLDAGHMREGVVVRVESAEGTSYLKNKSWNFGVLEGYIKDSEDYVDTEEAEEVAEPVAEGAIPW